MRLTESLLALALTAGCTNATPSAGTDPEWTVHQYSPTSPAEATAGRSIEVVWTATRTGLRTRGPLPTQFCSALAGPHASVEELKARPLSASECPLQSETVLVRSAVDQGDAIRDVPVRQELALPASLPTGLYQVIAVSVTRGSDRGHSVSSSHIIQIRGH